MSKTEDIDRSRAGRTEIDDRYSSFDYGDNVVVYDAEDRERWILSDASVDLADAV